MRKRTWKKLDAQFAEFPRTCGEAASDSSISAAEMALGCTFHEDYREFLRRYGSAAVGSGAIYGVKPCPYLGKQWSTVEVTRRFREQGWPGVDDWYIISGDGRGNPIGMDPRGRVWMSDHDVGDIPLVARSFEKYLLDLLAAWDEKE